MDKEERKMAKDSNGEDKNQEIRVTEIKKLVFQAEGHDQTGVVCTEMMAQETLHMVNGTHWESELQKIKGNPDIWDSLRTRNCCLVSGTQVSSLYCSALSWAIV